MIRIWKLKDAPPHLKELCPVPSDATWVVEVPLEMRDEVEAMVNNQLTSLQDVVSIELPGGAIVFFGEQVIELTNQPSSTKSSTASGTC
jgi:hypothetical protein